MTVTESRRCDWWQVEADLNCGRLARPERSELAPRREKHERKMPSRRLAQKKDAVVRREKHGEEKDRSKGSHTPPIA
jgi:hypothetical protein